MNNPTQQSNRGLCSHWIRPE